MWRDAQRLTCTCPGTCFFVFAVTFAAALRVPLACHVTMVFCNASVHADSLTTRLRR